MMKLFFYLILKICSIVIVNGKQYYGFKQICHQIVQHSFNFYNHGTEHTQITKCKLVNIQIDNYDNVYDNTLELKIFLDKKQIESLTLHKTDGLLASGNTPVYFSSVVPPINYTNLKSQYFFNSSTIHECAPELGHFKMYHDRNKTASMIVFQRTNSFRVEGNVGNYILRRLPYIQYLSTKYAYIQIKNNYQDKKFNNYVNNTNLSYDLQAPHLNDVLINLLVVLDSSSIGNPRVEFMRTLLMYFNYIDMFYGNFTSPKIKFTIRGIVLPPVEDFIPYLGNNRASTSHLDATDIQKTIRTMYRVHNNLFNLNNHDIIAIMTQRLICNSQLTNDDEDNNDTYNDDQCFNSDTYTDYICKDGSYPNIITVLHSDFQGYHAIFLDALSSILGYNERTDESWKNCTGISQDKIFDHELKYPLAWSACDVQHYSDQFRKFDCSYFKRNESILEI